MVRSAGSALRLRFACRSQALQDRACPGSDRRPRRRSQLPPCRENCVSMSCPRLLYCNAFPNPSPIRPHPCPATCARAPSTIEPPNFQGSCQPRVLTPASLLRETCAVLGHPCSRKPTKGEEACNVLLRAARSWPLHWHPPLRRSRCVRQREQTSKSAARPGGSP